ncbi:PrgI family protein [Massiliimalia timonensis]|uniref:PrgI family protein n=1 Tax=Massiliimalia timonensis TaxID=1987501 RepID=UPI000B8B5975|nr:PrgI family protein [Massiliimalia timonensis]
MEIKIPKEIQDYQETVFFGLSLRQFLCSLLAVLAAVGLYFVLHPVLGTQEVGWICILGAAPFAVCGFFKYHGMTAEKFVWAWIKSEILYPKKLVFKSQNLYHEMMKEKISQGEKLPRKRKNNHSNLERKERLS